MDNSLNNLRTRFNNLQWGASAPESLPQPTPLPPMFVDMEKRFEQLILIQNNLLRILDNKKPLDINNKNTGILFEDGFNEFTKTMTKTLDSVTSASKEAYTNILKKSTSMNFPQQQSTKANPKPANPYMAMAYVLSDSGVELGIDTVLGQALFKASVIQQKIGESKLKMENELKSKLNSQHLQEFNYLCDQAKISLKRVYNSQAKLNQIKNTISRTGRANEETAMSLALNQSQFDEGVAQCMTLLQEIISKPETIEIVNLFITNQKQFHQESYQILQDLQPQVQDLFHSQLGFASPPPASPLPKAEDLPKESTPPTSTQPKDIKIKSDEDEQDVDFEEIL